MHVHVEICMVTQSDQALARSSSGKPLDASSPIVLTSQYIEDLEDVFVKL
jgi:hypothetical protein